MRPPVGAITRGNPPSVEFTEDELQEMQVQESSPRNRAELALLLSQGPRTQTDVDGAFRDGLDGAAGASSAVGLVAYGAESTWPFYPPARAAIYR